jgi:hypothetical protein
MGWCFNFGKREYGTSILQIEVDLQWWVFVFGISNDVRIFSFHFLCVVFIYYKKTR